MNPASIDFSCLISSSSAKKLCGSEGVYGFIKFNFLSQFFCQILSSIRYNLYFYNFAIEIHL